MAVALLSDARVAELRGMPFTYGQVGQTAGRFPSGFAALNRARVLPDDVDFERAATRLMTWQLHSGAGLRVAASNTTVEEGAVVVLGFGLRGFALSAPCRVVYVIDDVDCRGFAYGTLAGHPESGEERFVVRRADDRVELAIDAFSRPHTALAKLGSPMVRWAQNRITNRYLHALDT